MWLNGNSEAHSAQLCPSNQTLAQRFYISGKGLSTSTTDWTLYFAQDTTTFTGGIDLLSPAAFYGYKRAIAHFDRPITGNGGLKLQVSDAGSYMRFNATNTYEGATDLLSDASSFGTLLVPAGGGNAPPCRLHELDHGCPASISVRWRITSTNTSPCV